MKHPLLIALFLFTFSFIYAQVPQTFTYQAVATDDMGIELSIVPLKVKAAVVRGTPSGIPQWVEEHDVTTDEFGLFTIEVGNLSNTVGVLTSFSDIPWGDDNFWLRIEIDLTATGSSFNFVGVKSLNSVPYALYSAGAERAKEADTALDDMDRDTTNEIQSLIQNGNQISLSDGGGAIDISTMPIILNDMDSDTTNELQDLELTGNMLTISGGNSYDLSTIPAIADDMDRDTTNELQTLMKNGNQIYLTGVPGVIDISTLPFAANDMDTDTTNELQDLELTGNILAISGGNSYDLSTIPAISDDMDRDTTNELQTLMKTGNEISLSGVSGSIDISTIPAISNDMDRDSLNEIQDLKFNGTEIYLTGSSEPPLDLTTLPVGNDNDPTNEIQQLQISGDTLSITGGNMLLLSDALSGAGGFNDPGASIDYPQGITDAIYIFEPDQFTVPPGKTFYIIAAEDELRFPTIGNDIGLHLTGPNMPIIGQNVQIDNCRCIGFLKDYDDRVVPEMVVLDPNQGNFFMVPSDKNFVIKSGLDATTPITLDGTTVNLFSGTLKAIVIPAGIQIRNIGNDEVILTGYMIEN